MVNMEPLEKYYIETYGEFAEMPPFSELTDDDKQSFKNSLSFSVWYAREVFTTALNSFLKWPQK